MCTPWGVLDYLMQISQFPRTQRIRLWSQPVSRKPWLLSKQAPPICKLTPWLWWRGPSPESTPAFTGDEYCPTSLSTGRYKQKISQFFPYFSLKIEDVQNLLHTLVWAFFVSMSIKACNLI